MQLSDLFCCDIQGSGDKMSHFHQTVHIYKDRVITFRGWQFDDEIHGNGLPVLSGNGERLKSPKRSVTGDFILSTGVTGIDVFIDKLSHLRAMIVLRQQLQSLLLTQMTRDLGIVVLSENIYLYLIDSWYIHLSVVQHPPLCIGGEWLEVGGILDTSR